MANEITFGFITGESLYATVYESDGTSRTVRAAMAEDPVSSGYYHKTDGNIQPGDFVMIDDETRFVGQGQYEPDVTVSGGSASGVTPAGYPGDYIKADTIYFLWRTTVAPSVAGTLKVYENDDTGQLDFGAGAGITDTRDYDGRTNLHLCKIDLSTNSFFEKGNDYTIILSEATIDGNSVNAVVAIFSIENRYSGKTFIRQG